MLRIVLSEYCSVLPNQVFCVGLLPAMVRVGILHQSLIYLCVLSIVTFLAIERP